MPIEKLLGITSGVYPYQQNINPSTDFVKNSFNFGNANPNRPEGRDDVHGKFLYCLG